MNNRQMQCQPRSNSRFSNPRVDENCINQQGETDKYKWWLHLSRKSTESVTKRALAELSHSCERTSRISKGQNPIADIDQTGVREQQTVTSSLSGNRIEHNVITETTTRTISGPPGALLAMKGHNRRGQNCGCPSSNGNDGREQFEAIMNAQHRN